MLSGGGSVPATKASAETWQQMVNQLQKAALSTRHGIPMIYGIDAVHGHNNVYNATIFPHNVGLGVTRKVYGYARIERVIMKSHLITLIGMIWFFQLLEARFEHVSIFAKPQINNEKHFLRVCAIVISKMNAILIFSCNEIYCLIGILCS